MLLKHENNEKILLIIGQILSNINNNDNDNDNLIFENYQNYSKNFQKIFSYRLFNPLNPKYNYFNIKEMEKQ